MSVFRNGLAPTKIYFHKNSHRVVDKTSHILYFFYQVVSIVLYNLMTNRLVNSDLKDRLRGAAHLGRAGGLQDNRFFFHHYDGGFVLESLIFISQANASSWRARLTRNQNTSDQVFPTTKDHCNAN